MASIGDVVLQMKLVRGTVVLGVDGDWEWRSIRGEIMVSCK